MNNNNNNNNNNNGRGRQSWQSETRRPPARWMYADRGRIIIDNDLINLYQSVKSCLQICTG
jgi:hypothetical protein